ncbi:cellulose biosynthesis protein BcsN [Methylobacterium isbiliense]|uniref:Cellulose biosynthesis protein BcsN n=1 Tax=Methylobacterium isbiliense TaxID=315478 RepID=A0ABQ4SHI9_9HYPH|nr:cellulose biosynthesis protein BcsN [Methylobacterium isbiliense]GJE02572.1 hypothetical protein GMJLKIPL_4521 [Methylobacterium isbiliense]
MSLAPSRLPARPLAAALLLAPALGHAQPAPVLRLPGAGPVTGVEELRVRDGFDQAIRFGGGDGRNRAEIGLRTDTGDLLLAFPPRLAKPNELGIAGELAARFPGQVMRVVPTPHRNAYGPIGLALGADCLYAWQWFERPSRAALAGEAPRGLFGPLAPPPSGRQALSLRIRLCRTAQASLADLVRAVQHLTISLGRAGAVTVAVPARGAPARPERPRPRAAPPPAARAAPAPAQAGPAQSKPARPAPEEPAARAPQPRPPAAPQSETSEGGRRYIAPLAPPAPAPAPVPQPGSEAAPPGGPQRFITDGLPQPVPPAGSNLMPQPAPGRTTGESLSRDLPPEAYQPPRPPP